MLWPAEGEEVCRSGLAFCTESVRGGFAGWARFLTDRIGGTSTY